MHNRGAIVQPWKEYRTEGNSYFLFLLLLTVAVIAVFIAFALLIIVPVIVLNRHEHHELALIPLLLFVIIFPLALLLMTLAQFVAPLMYRRRCRVWPAITDLLSLLGEHLAVFILYVLFGFVVGIAVAILIIIATCLTCCIAAIPYVGTVILLPVYVFLQSFSLLFLRQFGSDYDVWATLPPPAPSAPPPLPAE